MADDPTARGDLTRRAMLDAAVDRFGRDGYRRTSVTGIARQAGLGSTTTYVHYPTKEALFLAAVEHDLSSLFATVVETIDAVDAFGGSRGPTALIADLLTELDRHPLARRLIAGLEPDLTDRMLESTAIEVLGSAVTERVALGQELGAIRSDVAADVLADGLISVVTAVAMAAVQVGAPAIARRSAGIDAVFATLLTQRGSSSS